jgi:hypothetical protein
LFESTGALGNIRFFGPALKFVKNENLERVYANDSSDDDLVKLSILLFPSPTGILCHIRTMESNFGNKMRIKLEAGNRDVLKEMAELFAKILNNEVEKEMSFKAKNPDEVKMVRNISLRKTKTEVFSEPDSKVIKLLMLHSFIINILDDVNHLKEYLLIILNKITNFEGIPKLEIDALDRVLLFRDIYEKFPYSDKNQPPSNTSIPIYDGETKIFIPTQTFSDCADVMLLNLCNCLLYDSKNLCYSTEKLPKGSDIELFYQKHNRLFTITNEIRNEWSMVIQGLDNFEPEDKSPYKLDKITYKIAQKRNEVKSGIINMMNVLIKIFNINHEELWKDFEGKNDIESKLKQLFSLISSDSTKISISNCRFEEREVVTSRKEILGSFDIERLQEGSNVNAVMTVDHAETHAKILVKKFELKSGADIQVIQTDSIMNIIYMNFISVRKVKSDVYDFIKQIYFSGSILTNEQKKACLESIFEEIINGKNRNNLPIPVLKSITVSILESMNLNDAGTRNELYPYLIYADALSTSDTLKGYSYVLNKKEYSESIKELCRIKVSEIKDSTLKLDEEDLDGRITDIFKALVEKQTLERLIVLINKIDTQSIEKVFGGLGELVQLKELDIPKPESFFVKGLTYESVKLLFESLSKLLNLTTLEISQSFFILDNYDRIDELSESIQEHLNQLTELKSLIILDFNFVDSTELLSKILPKLKNLKTLKLLCHQEYGIKKFENFTNSLGLMEQLTEFAAYDIDLD